MKILTILTAALMWTNLHAASCPNFSGNYRVENEDSEVSATLRIEQLNCDVITLKIFEGNNLRIESFELNGKKVKHAEYPEIGLTSYATSEFKGDDIIIKIENHWIDNGKIDKFNRRLHLELSNTTYLLDQIGNFRNDGIFIPSTQTSYLKF